MRGVVLWKGLRILGSGFNHPPGDRVCTDDAACWSACGQLCIHAEAQALRSARARGPFDVVHVKVRDDKLVPGGGPSCSACARDLLDDGRTSGVWLFHDGGWKRYPIGEFYELSMAARSLPVLPRSSTRGLVDG